MSTGGRDRDLEQASQLYVYWMSKGFSGRDLHAKVAERYGEYPPEIRAEAHRIAQRILRTSERAAALDPQQRLREALGRLSPPEDTVLVRVLVQIERELGVEDIYRTINVEASWDETKQSVIDRAISVATSDDRYGEQVIGPDTNIIFPVWYSQPERETR